MRNPIGDTNLSALGVSEESPRKLHRFAVQELRRAGHRVPGLVDRRILFLVSALDASGAVLREAELAFDSVAYLPLEESVALKILGEAVTLRVRGLHDLPGVAEPVPFLDVLVRVE